MSARVSELDALAPGDVLDHLAPPDPREVARSLSSQRLVHRVIQLAAAGDSPDRLAAYRAELEWRCAQ